MIRKLFVMIVLAGAAALIAVPVQASFNPPPPKAIPLLIVQQPTVLDCHQIFGKGTYCRGNYTVALTDATVIKTATPGRLDHQWVVCAPFNTVYGNLTCAYGGVL